MKGACYEVTNPITQEIPRVFGALCQELETKIKYIFYYTTLKK